MDGPGRPSARAYGRASRRAGLDPSARAGLRSGRCPKNGLFAGRRYLPAPGSATGEFAACGRGDGRARESPLIRCLIARQPASDPAMAYRPFDPTGKVAVITGGNSGSGFGMAEALAAAGAASSTWDRNAERNA